MSYTCQVLTAIGTYREIKLHIWHFFKALMNTKKALLSRTLLLALVNSFSTFNLILTIFKEQHHRYLFVF